MMGSDLHDGFEDLRIRRATPMYDSDYKIKIFLFRFVVAKIIPGRLNCLVTVFRSQEKVSFYISCFFLKKLFFGSS